MKRGDLYLFYLRILTCMTSVTLYQYYFRDLDLWDILDLRGIDL